MLTFISGLTWRDASTHRLTSTASSFSLTIQVWPLPCGNILSSRLSFSSSVSRYIRLLPPFCSQFIQFRNHKSCRLTSMRHIMKSIFFLTHAVFAMVFFASFSTSQTVTVTRTRSNSSCYPTTPTLSTTTVPVTVVVLPTPSRDAAFNRGEPFVISIQVPVGPTFIHKRQEMRSIYIMANGNTTTNASMAAEFRIVDSRLYVNGIKMSVAPGVRSMPFAVDSNPGSINTSFSVNSGGLNWTDSAFTNSTAQFYKVPPEEVDNALLLVQFIGEPDPELGLSPINMAAQRRRFSPWALDGTSCCVLWRYL